MFVSTVVNSIDSKSRISVPAEFRVILANEGFAGIYVWRSFNGAFLEGGGARLLSAYADAIEDMAPYDEARNAFEHVIFSGARALMFDTTGRVSLPRSFLDHGNLNRQGVFVGLGQRFEIWNPEDLKVREEKALSFARENRVALKPFRRSTRQSP